MALNFIVCGVGKVQVMKAQISRGLAMATVSLSFYWHEPKPGGWGKRYSEIKGRVKGRSQARKSSDRKTRKRWI